MKILTPLMIAALAGGVRLFREDVEGSDGSSPAAPAAGRQITMDDGSIRQFGEKQRMQKDYDVSREDGNISAVVYFDNGKAIEVLLPAGSLAEAAKTDSLAKVALTSMGHGLVQKLGDAAAGAESTDDAFEAILEVATRINKGEWTKAREGSGTGSAKGASELVQALTEHLSKDKETVRGMLSQLTASDKAALRRVPEIAEIIEKLRAAKAPSKKEAERLAGAASLLAGMREGNVPVREEATAAE